MRYTTGIVALTAFCGLAGCSSQPPSPPPGADADADFGGWTWDAIKPVNAEGDDVAVSAAWGSWKKKFVYVILADVNATATTSINTSGERTRYEVDVTLPNGRKGDVRIETADGK